MSLQIIVDSSTDLRDGLKERLTVIPMSIRFGQTEYVDGVTIDRTRFYQMLVESDVLPTTSQVSPADFGRVFGQVAAAGDTAVVITLSGKLSGTCQSAMLAAQDYPGVIRVVDSESAAVGAGILAEEAVLLRDSGLGCDALADSLDRRKKDIRVIAMLDTLEYLKKGGRISATAAFAGGLLSIKPVVAIADGEVKVLGKARGSRQGNNLLVQEIEKAGGVDFSRPVLLGWTGLSDGLLRKYIQDSWSLWGHSADELHTTQISSVIGVHTGPGTIAAAFFSSSAAR